MEKHRQLAVLAAVLLASCGRADIGAVHYAHDQCQRVDLIDTATGWPLRGAEDFALDAQGGRLFISAYDRRAVERAVRRHESPPSGGVYTVLVAELFEAADWPVMATPLAAPSDIDGGLRPHGLSLDKGAGELVFINRTYQREGRNWRMTPRMQRIGANGEAFIGDAAPVPCSANDVLAADHQILTTFDHGGCGWRNGFEDVFALKHSGVAGGDGEALFAGVGFANGLARGGEGELLVAATREKAIIILNEQNGALTETRRIIVPGGPDNLSIARDGGVVAAVHPSLWRLALNRKMGAGKAPSRIVKADIDSGAVRILFDDPKGELFSAATIAVQTQRGLIAGSVTDIGVLVCREGA